MKTPTPSKARKMWLYTGPETGIPVEPWQVLPKATRSPPPSKPDVPCFVLPASSMDKVIERAARKMYEAHAKASQIAISQVSFQWPNERKPIKTMWRMLARAAYRAGGFVS